MSDPERWASDAASDTVTACGLLLEEGQREIADACCVLLSRLAEPDEAPGQTWFRGYFTNVAGRTELCQKAAFAALAVLLEAPGMDLPIGIEQAFDMPQVKP